jgi:hypothetical protein
MSLLVAWMSGLALAQEPAKDKLPAPKPLAPMAIELIPIREDRYAVWQNYGVDRYGRFRPVVVLPPGPAYYRINGKPFPWVSTHSMDIMPYVVD